jgi:hypothetical protein
VGNDFQPQTGGENSNFLQENGIDSYEDLAKKASSSSGDFAILNTKIRDTENRMKEVSELQKYIGQYGKTREIFAAYKKSGWSPKFYEEHTADIILHRAAKKYFDTLGLKKLPSINQLKQEYATLVSEKKKLYSTYRETKENSRQLQLALANAKRMLGVSLDEKNHAADRTKQQSNSQEI